MEKYKPPISFFLVSCSITISFEAVLFFYRTAIFENRSPKAYYKGLRAGKICDFEFYRTAIILKGKGSVSHREAIEKAEREFTAYRQREMEQLESDFDKMVKQLPKSGKASE